MVETLVPVLLAGLLGLVVGILLGRRRGEDPRTLTPDPMASVNAALQSLAEQVRRTEVEQVAATAELRATVSAQLQDHVNAMVRSTDDVRREAASLRAVLGRSGARGRWGEMQLRRLVEAAGLLEQVHFDEQHSLRTDDGLLRPDMIIRLPGDRRVAVDAKVPLAAFLALEQSQADHAALLAQHADDVVRHIDALSSRGYQDALDGTDFVVLFLPAESLLEAALVQRPELLDLAFSKHVIPATPTTLFALLRIVGVSWREERLAENAAEISRLGQELHGRLAVLAGHFARLGSSLDAAVTNYNKAIGSLESRVLVTARAFQRLGVTDAGLPAPTPVTQPARALAAAELVDGATVADPTAWSERAG